MKAEMQNSGLGRLRIRAAVRNLVQAGYCFGAKDTRSLNRRRFQLKPSTQQPVGPSLSVCLFERAFVGGSASLWELTTESGLV
jgi:hypothetical protein